MTLYYPTFRTQRVPLTGDPNARLNCGAYTGAMLLDAATEGESRVSGYTFRSRTDEPVPNPSSPGLNVTQVAKALQLLGVKDAKATQEVPWDTVRSLARDHFLGLVIRYGDVPKALRFSQTFTGNHMIAVGSLEGDGTVWVGDPLAYHSVRLPLDAYRSAFTILGSQLVSVKGHPLAPASRTYTVRRGDTLWAIAEAFYGDGRKWGRIATANAIRDPRRLRIGAVLNIP